MKRALKVLFFLLACSAACPLGGCLWVPPTIRWHGAARRLRVPTQICCSPDGRFAAYAEVELVDCGLRCYHGAFSLSGHRESSYVIDWRDCDVSVHIVDARSPGQVRSIDLGTRRPFDRIIDLKFSPDGSYLAALDPSRIVLIDVKTGRWRTLSSKPQGRSLAWLSNAELAYLASSAVWRQKIRQQAEEARKVFPGEDGRLLPSGLTGWSPDGRYVIIGNYPGLLHVVDLLGEDTFTVTARGPWRDAPSLREVAWSPDSTSAICWINGSAGTHRDRLYADQVLRVEPSRRQATVIKELVGPDWFQVRTALEFAPKSWLQSRVWNQPIPTSRYLREICRKEDYTDVPAYVGNNAAWRTRGRLPLFTTYSRDGSLGAEMFEKQGESWAVRVVLLKPPTSRPTTNGLAN